MDIPIKSMSTIQISTLLLIVYMYRFIYHKNYIITLETDKMNKLSEKRGKSHSR